MYVQSIHPSIQSIHPCINHQTGASAPRLPAPRNAGLPNVRQLPSTSLARRAGVCEVMEIACCVPYRLISSACIDIQIHGNELWPHPTLAKHTPHNIHPIQIGIRTCLQPAAPLRAGVQPRPLQERCRQVCHLLDVRVYIHTRVWVYIYISMYVYALYVYVMHHALLHRSCVLMSRSPVPFFLTLFTLENTNATTAGPFYGANISRHHHPLLTSKSSKRQHHRSPLLSLQSPLLISSSSKSQHHPLPLPPSLLRMTGVSTVTRRRRKEGRVMWIWRRC